MIGMMMRRYIFCLLAVLALSACSSTGGRFHTPQASGYYAAEPIQCVPYARDVSGIPIYGDAHTWWAQAGKKGNAPQPGAVLVLAKTGKLRYGHLAVVKDVLSPRRITVTHSNWGSDFNTRRVIYERMLVEDLSPANNWTSVRFWNKDINAFGLPYAAYGFIYRQDE